MMRSPRPELARSLIIGVQMRALMAEVQVIVVEHRDAHQCLEVRDGQRLDVQLDEPVPAKLLKSPVDVHGGEAARIGNVHLGEWELAATLLREAYGS